MKKQLFFAQKAIIFKKNKGKLSVLLVKIKDAPKNSKIVIGKYGFPGGRMEFGEEPDQAIIRECREETGVTVEPKNPVELASWFVKKPNEHNQIVVIFRICDYIEGEISGYVSDEAKLEGCEWVDTNTFNFEQNLIEDNLPALKSALKAYLS